MATPGCHQPIHQGGQGDAFLGKFKNANGSRVWSTYYGGNLGEAAYSVLTDNSGNVFLSGYTASTGSYIATPGSYQSSPAGAVDVFLAKFDSSGVRQWGTFYGAIYDEYLSSASLDPNGNIFLVGYTNSSMGLASAGAHQINLAGSLDAFIVKFDYTGQRQWCTYYGDSGNEYGFSCAADGSGNIYLAGSSDTNTSTSLTTSSAYQSAYPGGPVCAYLAKFNSTGQRQWATFYGDAGGTAAYACFTHGNDVYIGGNTLVSSTGNLIASMGSYQSSFGGGSGDAFLAKFNSAGARQWGTFYGGTGDDFIYALVLDPIGSFYVSGCTSSNTGTAIASVGSHQPNFGGGIRDAFLARFDECSLAPVLNSPIDGTTTMCTGSGIYTYSVALVSDASNYVWTLPATWSYTQNFNTISAVPGSSGVFSVSALNGCGASFQQTLQVTVNALPTITVSSSANMLCVGESATLTASGAQVYTFTPGGSGTNIVISPGSSQSYTVTGTNSTGCSDTTVFNQVVNLCTQLDALAPVSDFRIYPNPNSGILNIELDSDGEYALFNSVGQMIYSDKILKGKKEINLEALPKGLYLLRLKNKSIVKNFNIVKE